MQVEHELLSPTRCRVHLTVPAAAVDVAFRTVTTQIAQRAQIKGFRPGKAPPNLVERMFAADIRARVLDQLLRVHVPQAVAQVDVQQVTGPEVDRLSELQKGQPLQVSVQFEVHPKLAFSGYRGAELSAVEVVADAADVEAELERMRQERAELAPVDGAVQDGDTLEISYTVTDAASGESVESQQDHHTTYTARTLGTTVYRAFAGAKVGDEVDQTLSNEAEPEVMLRVQGKLISVSRPSVPALDDELAVDVGFADLATARAELAQTLAKRAQDLTTELREKIAVDHLLATNTVPVPPTLVHREVEGQLQHLRRQFSQLGGGMDSFFDSYRQMLTAETRKSVARSLALHHIVQTEAVQADAQAVQASIEDRIARNPKLAREIRRNSATPEGQREAEFIAKMEAARALLVQVGQWTVTETLSLAAYEKWKAHRAEAEETALADEAAASAGHVHGPDCDHDHDHDHEPGPQSAAAAI